MSELGAEYSTPLSQPLLLAVEIVLDLSTCAAEHDEDDEMNEVMNEHDDEVGIGGSGGGGKLGVGYCRHGLPLLDDDDDDDDVDDSDKSMPLSQDSNDDF